MQRDARRPQGSAPLRLASLGAATLLGACTGNLDAGTPPARNRAGTALVCDAETLRASPAGMLRLAPDEYVATVRDLVGAPELPVRVTDPTPVMTELGLRELREAAEATVAARASWGVEVIPCDTASGPVTGCVEAFLDGFAARAYRHPLTSDERARLMETFTLASASGLTFADAMDVLVQVVLLAPQVIYRNERGVADASLPEGVNRLTDYEMAARLSYVLWGTTPDDALLARAAARGLSQPADIRAEAERLIAAPRGQRTLNRFIQEWLELDGGLRHPALETVPKDAALFPEDSPALRAAMRTEIDALVTSVMRDEGGSIEALFTSRRAYLNGPLAAFYGVAHGGGANDFRWLELPAGERSGLLTRAGFLAVSSGPRVPSPIRRGVFVLQEVLCAPLGTPPANANNVIVDGGAVLDDMGQPVVRSVREDVHARTSGPACASCHDNINPIGFSFSHYDALGIFRTQEQLTSLPIDATGALSRSGDQDGPVTDAIALSERLAASDATRACVADRLLSSLYGAAASQGLSPCVREAIRTQAITTGRIEDIVLAIITDDAFRTVDTRIETPTEGVAP